MSGNSATSVMRPTAVIGAAGPTAAIGAPLSQSRAARELGLKRREFDLAVHLGYVRTIADDGGGGLRVARTEIDRVRSADGFPEALETRIRIVGTAEGAALMKVTGARFTRLARLGHLIPVSLYLNRYRAVIWLYRAEELARFAADEENAPLLSGRTPVDLRDRLDAGLDLRPRTWRERHLGFLLDGAHDPWARAAALASLLDPVQIAELVRDPYERAYVNRLRPARPVGGTPGSPADQVAARIMTADDPDETARLRSDLRQTLAEAREHRSAPRPAAAPVAEPPPVPRPSGGPKRAVACRPGRAETVGPQPSSGTARPCEAPRKPRGLLGRWRRRNH